MGCEKFEMKSPADHMRITRAEMALLSCPNKVLRLYSLAATNYNLE